LSRLFPVCKRAHAFGCPACSFGHHVKVLDELSLLRDVSVD
jgi:hypothetical protein